MEWDDGWYTGTFSEHPTMSDGHRLFTIAYDDGDIYQYRREQNCHPKLSFRAQDKDGDEHLIYLTIPQKLGGAGVLIETEQRCLEYSLPTGAVGSSFDTKSYGASPSY